jgi:hypothetical protein
VTAFPLPSAVDGQACRARRHRLGRLPRLRQDLSLAERAKRPARERQRHHRQHQRARAALHPTSHAQLRRARTQRSTATIAAMDKPRCRQPNRFKRLIAFLPAAVSRRSRPPGSTSHPPIRTSACASRAGHGQTAASAPHSSSHRCSDRDRARPFRPARPARYDLGSLNPTPDQRQSACSATPAAVSACLRSR